MGKKKKKKKKEELILICSFEFDFTHNTLIWRIESEYYPLLNLYGEKIKEQKSILELFFSLITYKAHDDIIA